MDSRSFKNMGYKKWIKDKAKKLLTPYIVLSVVALLPKYYWEQHSLVTLNYLIEAIFKPRVGVWGHFWYIPVLLLCYSLFGVWKCFVTDSSKNYMLFIATMLSLILYFFPLSTEWFGFSDLKKACLFFCLGMIVKQKLAMQERNNTKCLLLIELVLETAGAVLLEKKWYNNELIGMVIALLMISVCWQLAKIIGSCRLAVWISNYKYTFYIYSWPFQALVMEICERMQIMWYFTSVIMFVAGMLGPIIIIIGYEKLDKIHNWILDLILGMN